MLDLTICPTCGSKKLKRVRKDWDDDFNGKSYIVRDLEYWECPACGEKLFDANAMRKIEAVSPAYAARRKSSRPKVKGKKTSVAARRRRVKTG